MEGGGEEGRGERNRDRIIEQNAKTSLKSVKQREMGVSSAGGRVSSSDGIPSVDVHR